MRDSSLPESLNLATAVCALIAALGCATIPSSGSVVPGIRAIAGPQGRLVVDDGGSGGVPILFVHGNGGNRTQWAAQLAHFRKHRRAVAFDLRGMGESDLPADRDYSIEAFGQDVAAVADALRLGRFVLVGHSFGGPVVAAYAGRHPQRLVGLVFADSAGDLRNTPPDQIETLRKGLAPETYARFTEAWFDAILKNATPQTRLAVLRSLHATPRDVFVGATLALYSFPFNEALSRYGGPKLSISSFLLESPLAVHNLIRTIPVRAIHGASHWLMMDRPDEFNAILDQFLRGLP